MDSLNRFHILSSLPTLAAISSRQSLATHDALSIHPILATRLSISSEITSFELPCLSSI